MTRDEAEIVVLKDALMQAQYTVDFLHNCLIYNFEGYSYGYPEHTLKDLKEWAKLAPLSTVCFHSGHDENCNSCVEHMLYQAKLNEAKKTLTDALIVP